MPQTECVWISKRHLIVSYIVLVGKMVIKELNDSHTRRVYEWLDEKLHKGQEASGDPLWASPFQHLTWVIVTERLIKKTKTLL